VSIKNKRKNKTSLRNLQRNTRNKREKYEEVRKETSKLCRKKKKHWLSNRIKHIEEHHTKKDNRKFFKDAKEIQKGFIPREINCKDEMGNIILEKDKNTATMERLF
jgi:hypothetical protein